MNKRTSAVAFILLMIFILPVLGSTFAQTTDLAGVSVGDTFTYNNTLLWNSTLPSDIVPAYLIAQNQSTLKITVQQVSGSTVLLEKVWTYKNGTQDVSTEPDEVYGGVTGTVLVYAANLTAGSPLFPGASELPFTINETIFRSYSGNNFRETNHIIVNSTGTEGEAYSLMNLYFDKQTGILVEYYLTNVYTATPNQKITQHMLLVNSNVWTVSDTSSSSPDTSTATTPTSNPSGAVPSDNTPKNSDEGLPVGLILTILVVVVVIIIAGYFILRKGTSKLPETIKETN
jgi:hypothetical protein